MLYLILSFQERYYSSNHVLFASHTIAGEWYEDEFGVMHTCNGYEDPDCADRWYYTSVDDHMHYLGLPIGESWCIYCFFNVPFSR